REMLLANGFYQTTLTNFERLEFRSHERRFRYEEDSFRPDRHEMLGFGPSAISWAASAALDTAFKRLNPVGAQDYMRAVETRSPAWDRYFRYGPRAVRVFYLTRRLAALEIDRREYRRLFASDVLDDFKPELKALTDEGLIDITAAAIQPTPR